MLTKFTSDGKKVAVLGQLNATQSIVQEIFIVNDQEIPSGENFVVSSLHDERVLSWKQKEDQDYIKRLDNLKSEYEKEKRNYENETKRLRQIFDGKVSTLKGQINYAAEIMKNLSPESFTVFEQLLTGKINYVLRLGYSPAIISFEQMMAPDSDYDKEIKLISLYGNDKGNLQFYANQYSDGSGSKQPVYFFETLEEAVTKLKQWIDTQHVNNTILELAEKWKIEIDPTKLSEWGNKVVKNLQDNCNRRFKELQDDKKKLAEACGKYGIETPLDI